MVYFRKSVVPYFIANIEFHQKVQRVQFGPTLFWRQVLDWIETIVKDQQAPPAPNCLGNYRTPLGLIHSCDLLL